MSAMDTVGANLRYIGADQLRTFADSLDGAVLLSPANTSLGRLAGALIDPIRRQICYLVVESRSWLAMHQYLLPLGIARFDRERKALLVDVEAAELREVQVDTFQRFSDDDLIAALFSPVAA
jgi:hypothetical protein